MKKLLVMVSLLLLVLGCGGGEQEEPAADGTPSSSGSAADAAAGEPEPETAGGIVGAWEVVEVLEGEDLMNTGTVYTFGADGGMSSASGSFTIEGTYEVHGDTLAMVLGGVDMQAVFTLEGGKLVYEIVNGEQVFLMEPR